MSWTHKEKRSIVDFGHPSILVIIPSQYCQSWFNALFSCKPKEVIPYEHQDHGLQYQMFDANEQNKCNDHKNKEEKERELLNTTLLICFKDC